MVARAGTLLIPSGPRNNSGQMHLHVVCTDPCGQGNQLIVSTTTWANSLCDETCLLSHDDHEWLTHKSWVMYRAAKIESADTLNNGLKLKIFVEKKPIREDVLQKILKGFAKVLIRRRR